MKEWMKNVRQVEAYVPGEQPKDKNVVKLNTNENPYPPSEEVGKVLKAVNDDELKLYPSCNSEKLSDAIADYYGVNKDMVFVGVGSDDVLAMSFLTFFNSKKPILFANITYSFYDVWANLYNIPFENPKLDENFRIVKEDYYKENGGVVIANPNAPTGIFEPLENIEEIIKNNQDVVVIVDEAYIDFGGESAIKLVEKYDNLLVVQTFSKSRSLAGMRIGFCIGNSELIKALKTVKHSYNSYTLGRVSIETGTAAIKDKEYFEKTCKMIINTRENSKKRFRKLGFEVLDSKTNFLFVTHKDYPAKEIFEKLKADKVFVRYFNKPIIDNFLRVTIGTDEQMDILFGLLEKYISNVNE